MTVREITPEDRETFCKLCEDFYNSGATKRGYDRDSALLTFNQVISKHENLFGYFIIEPDLAAIAGYALITTYWCNEEAGNVIILDEIYIDPLFRHHGFGIGFLNWLDKEFRGRAVSVTLEVLSTNLAAKELYSKEGFEEDGFVTMSKKL